MLVILLLVGYITCIYIVFQTLKIREEDLKALGLLVPEYDDCYSADSFLYSLAWIVTVPITLFHYFCLKPLRGLIKDFKVDK